MAEIAFDAKTFKALSCETRISLLKQLGERRKTASELSEALSISAPSVLEHLDKLINVGLIVRAENGSSKWVYYELTEKGTILIGKKTQQNSAFPHSFVILAAVILAFTGIIFAASMPQDGAVQILNQSAWKVLDLNLQSLPFASMISEIPEIVQSPSKAAEIKADNPKRELPPALPDEGGETESEDDSELPPPPPGSDFPAIPVESRDSQYSNESLATPNISYAP